MKKVFAIADNVVSPLGLNSLENWNALLEKKSGVSIQNKNSITLKNFYASLFDAGQMNWNLENPGHFSKLEKLILLSINSAYEGCEIDLKSDKTLFLFSTTKGNIDLLEKGLKGSNDRINLFAMADRIAKYFKNPNKPVVISNACISGVLALIVANYYIQYGGLENVVVCGGDIISEFTVSGFQSLYALGKDFCRPFDKDRDGINLGEAASTIILSSNQINKNNILIKGGCTTNDANHISGPSKTGDGLSASINNTIKAAKIPKEIIGFISGHGTATLYNDEMEAKAIHLSGLGTVPVNSLKGYFGHTLGAAGVLESVMAIWALKNQYLIATLGYHEHGVSLPLNVTKENTPHIFDHCIKTSSGFGGCNASIIFSLNG